MRLTLSQLTRRIEALEVTVKESVNPICIFIRDENDPEPTKEELEQYRKDHRAGKVLMLINADCGVDY